MSDSYEWAHVLVVGEQAGGALSPGSSELLGKGRELADALGTYLWVYVEGEPEARAVISKGADRVFLRKKPAGQLKERVQALSRLIDRQRPEIILAPSSSIWLGILGRLAQRQKTALVSDCVGAEIDAAERRLVAVKPLYGGKLLSEWIWPSARPQIALFRPGLFAEPFEDAGREGVVEEI